MLAVEDIYKECDFITIHAPLLDSTKGMISKEAIAMMKENVIVLNFARDTLVDEAAMVEALKAGNKVPVAGFGTFAVSQRGERNGRNPQTGATVVIPARKAVTFKAGTALKESVN